MRLIGIVLGAALAGCGTNVVDSEHIAVDSNDLGIVALEVQRFEENGDKIFELRGLAQGDDELAAVRVRSGVGIEGLPADAVGSEITVSFAGNDTRLVTRALHEIELDGLEDLRSLQFVALPQVASALLKADILIDREASNRPTDEVAYEEIYTANCGSGQLLVTPVAKQCCYGNHNIAWQAATKFVNPSNAVVVRRYNDVAAGARCKASNGTGSCSGDACFFGPHGYGVPTVTTGSGYPRIEVGYYYEEPGVLAKEYCKTAWYASPKPAIFPDVTGTLQRGGGCCINGTGACNLTGFPACTACGGGGSAGVGLWDP
jgi:hypothetical protein